VSVVRLNAYTYTDLLAGVGSDAGSAPIDIKTPATLPRDVDVPAPIMIQARATLPRDADDTPPGSPTGSGSDSEDIPVENADEYDYSDHYPDLRKWCSGHPPKKSFLGTDRNIPPRFRMSRRSTLADKPELDVLLAATKVEYNGHFYLPLTAKTIHRLDPFFKGAKPLADMKLFECIVITHEVNGVHADHVVAALERIGEHCKHLLVMSPVQTSELGNVFAREHDNVNPGNDWDAILGCFPHLQYLAFVHHVDEPVGFSRNTFRGLQAAVARRQAAQGQATQEGLKGFSFNMPPALLM